MEGNAGSFFKNSLLTEEQYAKLEKRFERNLPEYVYRLREVWDRTFRFGEAHIGPEGPVLHKVPSAFILEACGLKGFSRGNVQLNPTQPVVVLNVTGEATADEVLSLVREVRAIVEEKTGLHLYTEPEMIGFSAEELRGYGFGEDEVMRYEA